MHFIFKLLTTLSCLFLFGCSTTTTQYTPNKYYEKPILQSSGSINPNNGIANTALEVIGTPYKYGGNSKAEGFDCSGLVAYSVNKSIGLKLPRTAKEQFTYGKHIPKSKLKYGDLVFFSIGSKSISHVGIYLYNGLFVHAPQSGDVVKIANMESTYWNRKYKGARRVSLIASK